MKSKVLAAAFGVIATVAVYELPDFAADTAVSTFTGTVRFLDEFVIREKTRIGTHALDTCTLYGAMIKLQGKVNDEYVVSVISSGEDFVHSYCQVGDLVAISQYEWDNVLEQYYAGIERKEHEKALVEFAQSL